MSDQDDWSGAQFQPIWRQKKHVVQLISTDDPYFSLRIVAILTSSDAADQTEVQLILIATL